MYRTRGGREQASHEQSNQNDRIADDAGDTMTSPHRQDKSRSARVQHPHHRRQGVLFNVSCAFLATSTESSLILLTFASHLHPQFGTHLWSTPQIVSNMPISASVRSASSSSPFHRGIAFVLRYPDEQTDTIDPVLCLRAGGESLEE